MMKRLLLILGIIIFTAILTSCGGTEIIKSTPQIGSLEISNIVGKTIKIQYFEIAENDFPYKLTWDNSKEKCLLLGTGSKNLGDEWRLPTTDELKIMYQNKEKIGGFANGLYWSSFDDDDCYALFLSFDSADPFRGTLASFLKENKCYVRAVRSL